MSTLLKIEVSNLLYSHFHKEAVETAMTSRLLELLGGQEAAKKAHDEHYATYQPPYSRWNVMFNQAVMDTHREIGLQPIERPLYRATFVPAN